MNRTRMIVLVGFMVLVVAGVGVALFASDLSGTGAQNVGSRPGNATAAPAEGCPATRSNPGGDNNYIPDAPPGEDLGDGFVIQGVVRQAGDCRPLPDVRIQVWLATRTGGESDNRTSVRTDAQGRYRVETAPTVAQFGEPNIHVGYDDDAYEAVFIRNVVDLDDTAATIDLNLRPR
ncbi:hypothetical protein [Paractinoplanes lichenicola]|uniref:Carboxypeptidase regulatory-like domain-containing protein n=1 Tax=Paractinoplanes lichenicola TaxID=2802976 RepID=A0ABS1VGD7_9ACTN|nr:hypothetical protein [Actinoplanes lichenicola]MBL7253536.1 hypothetical protein [Actinoplanes lichenicola]